MKLIYLLIFTATLSIANASDGEYRCDTIQNVSFRDLSSKVLSVSYHVDKVKELEENGLRSSALNIAQEGLDTIERALAMYKDKKFCYSLTKRADYQKSLLIKHQIELSLLSNDLKKHNDCSYAILKLEKETSLVNEMSETFYEKFIATSKTVTKAELIRRDDSCDLAQQEKISELLQTQNNLLSSLSQK